METPVVNTSTAPVESLAGDTVCSSQLFTWLSNSNQNCSSTPFEKRKISLKLTLHTQYVYNAILGLHFLWKTSPSLCNCTFVHRGKKVQVKTHSGLVLLCMCWVFVRPVDLSTTLSRWCLRLLRLSQAGSQCCQKQFKIMCFIRACLHRLASPWHGTVCGCLHSTVLIPPSMRGRVN